MSHTPAPARPDESRDPAATARDMEGVFVEQLIRAMRETVPTDSLAAGGEGNGMLSALLDPRLAGQVPGTWSHGLAEAVYRQLRGAASTASDADPPTAAPPAEESGDEPSR